MVPEIPQYIKATLNALKKHRFDARFARTVIEANSMMLEMIPPNAAIGIGDSVTLRQIGIIDNLVARGNRVINPFTPKLTQDATKRHAFIATCRKALTADIFMTGANAVTADGKILSIDYAGNRVAGMIFGGEKVILAVGRNKIVKNIDEATSRLKNVIVPFHAKSKGSKTPCAITGECSDCESPTRFCGVTVILERKLAHFDYSVILIDEDLGLSWDPLWDKNRIEEIKSNYLRNSWSFAFGSHEK